MTAAGGKNGRDAVAELLAELRHLRGEVREAAATFALRREGEIEAIAGILPSLPRRKAKDLAEEWLPRLRGVRLKPAKGRLRDLKEINRQVEELLEGVTSVQGPEKRKSRRAGRELQPAGLQ